jgi:plastocyanin
MLETSAMRSVRWILGSVAVCGVLLGTPAQAAPVRAQAACFTVLPAASAIAVGQVASWEITNSTAAMTAELAWGDGAAETHAFKTGETFTYNHAYASPGVYEVTLTDSAKYPNGKACWDISLLLTTITVT